MKILNCMICGFVTLCLTGCVSPSNSTPQHKVAQRATALSPLLEQPFVFAVLDYLYRWHFDQSFVLEQGKVDAIEVWLRPLHPPLDAGDRSEFAEMWIPAVNMRVELKRSDYRIPEMNLPIVDDTFKIERVTRQLRPPAARSDYQVGRYAAAEVREHLFATRTNQVPLSSNLRTAARKLVVEYLNRTHPDPFTEDQIFFIAPVSAVCNDVRVFWETGRKLMLFSADVDLASPSFAQLSQLRIQVIDLDTDVVASTSEVPGSNAFVTKDWVGRIFYNCILYGERVVRTPEQMNQLRAAPAGKPAR